MPLSFSLRRTHERLELVVNRLKGVGSTLSSSQTAAIRSYFWAMAGNRSTPVAHVTRRHRRLRPINCHSIFVQECRLSWVERTLVLAVLTRFRLNPPSPGGTVYSVSRDLRQARNVSCACVDLTPRGFGNQVMMLPAPTVPAFLRQWPAPTRIVTVSATDSDDARNPMIALGSGAVFPSDGAP